LAGSAGIALAFAFASFIGFEATAIYGEESREPKRIVSKATYTAVLTITILFALVSFAMVTGMGASTVVEETFERSGDLAEPAAVLFTLATEYVGEWMAIAMSVLVVTSLFAGALAFQNAAARYFFALGRGGVLPSALSRTNRRGAPWMASVLASIISGIVIIVFAIAQLDPITNLFFWFSGLAVIAIVLIEILVSIAIIAYFAKNKGQANVFQAIIAPALAIIGLAVGEYLLMSRFGLLAGTVEGEDPTVAWALSPLGWVLILLPFAVFVIGLIVAAVRRGNEELLKDLVS
jgi:amino acid transporter